MDKLWETLVFDFITGNCPCIASEQNSVTGVRLVQKVKNNNLITFRIEIWMDSDKEENPEVAKVKEYMNKEIKEEALKDVKFPGDAKWMTHAH